MLLALVLTLISVSSGLLLTYLFEEDGDLATRAAQGGPLGLVGFGLIGFVCSALIGLKVFTVVIAATLLMLIASLLGGARTWRRLGTDVAVVGRQARLAFPNPSKRFIALSIAIVLTSLVLWQVFDRAMFYRGGGIYTGVANDYGDLPFHLTVINRFAYGGNIPPEDPVYSGTRFTYPYLADFVPAMLMQAGAGVRGAMLLESLILIVSLLWLLGKWSLELTRDRLAAVISPGIVLLGSGLGFIMMFREARETERGLLSLIWRPLHDYTMVSDEGLRWGDSLTSLLVTQRSLLLGLPLALIIFRQWWKFCNRKQSQDHSGPSANPASIGPPGDRPALSSFRLDIPMAAAGVIAGFLPVCHTHSYLAVMGVGGLMALIFRDWRGWASFFVPAVLLGVGQAWSISHGGAARFSSFFTLNPGWESSGENFIWFWLKNTGVLIPLVVLAALRSGAEPLLPRVLLLYYLPFTLCFLIPNLVKLAPWTWDNMKVFIYWYLASAPLTALILAKLWRRGGWRSAASVLLVLSLVVSGGLNVLRVITRGESYAIFDSEQMAFAELIKQATPPNALILHAPVHDDPVFLTGRRSFMGYPGHIWTHGIDYVPRSNEIRQIYEGGPGARDLIARYKIEYAVVSPQERRLMSVDDAFFDGFGKVAEVGEYSLYKTR
jgi:hypothetical protein